MAARWLQAFGACALFIGCGEVVTNDAEPNAGSTSVGPGGKAPSGGNSSSGGRTSTGGKTSAPVGGKAEGGAAGADVELPPEPAGGAGGEGGAESPPFVWPDSDDLFGHYDVSFDQPPVIDGCTALSTISHLNFYVGIDASNAEIVSVSPDFGSPTFQYPEWFGNEPWLSIAGTGDSSGNELTPAIRLYLDADGFTGLGRAWLPYSCDGEVVLKELDITIGPDVTPPRIRLDPGFPGREVFPFTFFMFRFSEPLRRVGAAGVYDTFQSEEEVAASVAILDADTGQVLATSADTWPFGPAYGLVFDDYDAVRGHEIELDVIGAWEDYSGNAALAFDETLPVIDPGPTVASIDFEDAHVGAHGNATHYASGSPSSPCEAGGCLALSGTVPPCSDSTPLPALFSARLASADSAKFRVRYRVYSSQSHAPSITVREAPGCDITTESDVLVPLSQPEGALLYATPWVTRDFGCLGPKADKGIVLSLGCNSQQPTVGSDARLVIESVTLVP